MSGLDHQGQDQHARGEMSVKRGCRIASRDSPFTSKSQFQRVDIGYSPMTQLGRMWFRLKEFALSFSITVISCLSEESLTWYSAIVHP